MNKEGFVQALKQKYADDIMAAYVQCEVEGDKHIDFPKLNGLLWRLMKNAKVDGLNCKEFEDLVKSCLPEVQNRIELGEVKRVA